MGTPLPNEKYIGKYLQSEVMAFAAYTPDPIVSIFHDLPLQYTYANCFITPNEFVARSSVFNPIKRALMVAVTAGLNALIHWRFVYHKQDFLYECQDDISDLSDVFIWGYGLEPMLDK